MKNIKYILMVLLGGTLYGTMSSFIKLAYSKGYNAAELSFWQAFLAAILLSICTFTTQKDNKGKLGHKQILPLFLTGSTIGLTNFLYYESVSFIPASLAIIILMQFTWFSIFIEWFIYGRKPSKIEIFTVSLILIGTLLAGNIFDCNNSHISIKGIILALCSSLTYSIYIIANGRIGKGVRWQAKSMAIMVGSSLTIFAINYRCITESCYMSGNFISWAIFIAIVGTTIPTALFAAGISKIGAGLSSILMTIELPIAVICAHIILHEQIGSLQIAGIIIMFSAISAMNYYKVSKTNNNRHL